MYKQCCGGELLFHPLPRWVSRQHSHRQAEQSSQTLQEQHGTATGQHLLHAGAFPYPSRAVCSCAMQPTVLRKNTHLIARVVRNKHSNVANAVQAVASLC